MQQADGTKIYTNDLWKYSISTNTWAQIGIKKIISTIRSVKIASMGNYKLPLGKALEWDIRQHPR